jgi:uncharacterized protein
MGDFVLFPLNGITLALYPRQELAKDTTLHYQPSEFAGLTISYNTKSKQEVDEVLQQVEPLGERS